MILCDNVMIDSDCKFQSLLYRSLRNHIPNFDEAQKQNKIISDDNYTGVSFLESSNSGGKI
jgi:hypothetical protein